MRGKRLTDKESEHMQYLEQVQAEKKVCKIIEEYVLPFFIKPIKTGEETHESRINKNQV